MTKRIDVVGAVVISDDRVLCAQRGHDGSLPGKWEFPGGKVEDGETPQEALEREIFEELQCQIDVGEKVTTTAHEYDFGIVTLTTFYCELANGSPHLTEHANLKWLPPGDLADLDWAPADVPAVDIVQTQLQSR